MSELKRHDREIQKPAADRPETPFYREVDADTVEAIGQKFRDSIPPGRLEAMKNLPTQFDNREEFNRAYEVETGKKPESNVAGFAKGLDSSAHVVVENQSRVPEITAHERIHQAGHPNADRIFGNMYEGVTQDLTVKTQGFEIDDGTAAYPREHRAAEKLREVCGDKPIEKAYFQGDGSDLKKCLENADLNQGKLRETGPSERPLDRNS